VLIISYTPSRRHKLYPAGNPAAIRLFRRESRRYWASSAGNPAGIRQFQRDSAIPPGRASPGGICIPVPKHRESPLRWPRSGMKSVPPGFTSVPLECKIQAPSMLAGFPQVLVLSRRDSRRDSGLYRRDSRTCEASPGGIPAWIPAGIAVIMAGFPQV
jgi:hypothetical protein